MRTLPDSNVIEGSVVFVDRAEDEKKWKRIREETGMIPAKTNKQYTRYHPNVMKTAKPKGLGAKGKKAAQQKRNKTAKKKSWVADTDSSEDSDTCNDVETDSEEDEEDGEEEGGEDDNDEGSSDDSDDTDDDDDSTLVPVFQIPTPVKKTMKALLRKNPKKKRLAKNLKPVKNKNFKIRGKAPKTKKHRAKKGGKAVMALTGSSSSKKKMKQSKTPTKSRPSDEPTTPKPGGDTRKITPEKKDLHPTKESQRRERCGHPMLVDNQTDWSKVTDHDYDWSAMNEEALHTFAGPGFLFDGLECVCCKKNIVCEVVTCEEKKKKKVRPCNKCPMYYCPSLNKKDPETGDWSDDRCKHILCGDCRNMLIEKEQSGRKAGRPRRGCSTGGPLVVKKARNDYSARKE